tara:strand:+ start:44 stop:625 length:582 start_codon:yes stop_codon:yes gene_type:complete
MLRFEVIDNFLTKEEWKKQFDLVFSTDFKWTYGMKNTEVPGQDNSYWANQFKSVLFQYWFHGEETLAVSNFDPRFQSPSQVPNTKQPYWDIMCKPILDNFSVKHILNIRTNLYTWWHETNNEAGTHIDHQLDCDYITLIYYINGSDGATWFEGHGNIEKKPNRLVIADGKIPHRAVYQTNVKAQIATNINIIV